MIASRAASTTPLFSSSDNRRACVPRDHLPGEQASIPRDVRRGTALAAVHSLGPIRVDCAGWCAAPVCCSLDAFRGGSDYGETVRLDTQVRGK